MNIIKKENKVRILSIDPSTSFMGVSILDVDAITPNNFGLLYCRTIQGENVNHYPKENNNDDGVLARINGLCRALQELIEIYEPDEVICEDNYQGRNVSTFKTLVTVMSMLKQATIEKKLYFDTVYPNIAKDVVGANFRGTTKEDVMKGVMEFKYLDVINKNIDLSKLDEHSADSVAIGLYKCIKVSKYFNTYLGEMK